MKLKNRNTGEIVVFGEGMIDLNQIGCKNVAEMMEQGWEDYEEPKEYWYIDWTPNIGVYYTTYNGTDYDKRLKQIGNYFETKEEAETAVEKLKAWKRLRDNGFEFTGWDRHPDFPGDFRITASDEYTCDDKDLDLLFGGDE